jgi:AcrR family transcriptional regulator
MADQVAPVRPGRKRSDQSRRAILGAAVELFSEVGYAALTIEGIAARAGCGKQTIYRWWPSKADVLLEAMATTADVQVPLSDQGSFAADLRSFLESSFALGRQPQVLGLLCALMAQAQTDERFGDRFRAAFLYRRRDALSVVLARAADRGDVPHGLRPTTVLDIVFGVIWYRILATREPFDETLVDELVHVLADPDHPRPTRKERAPHG